MTRRDEPDVIVLDLRDGGCDLAQVEGPVLVLDHAETAAEHDPIYQKLLGSPQVPAVICLAVDGGQSNGVVTVRPAPSLAPADRAATLWIGHPHGIRWRPAEPRVRFVKPSEPSGLRQLIDALADPAVFEAVATCVSTLPYSTASPGLALERASLHEAELSGVQEEAVTLFTDRDARWVTAQELPRDEFRDEVRGVIEIDRTEDILVPDAELAAARAEVIEALNAANHEIIGLGHRFGLFPHRPGSVVEALVEEAWAAARDFHEKVTRQLERIDGNLRGQRITHEVVAALGVRPPAPLRAREIRDAVRHLVEKWLVRYRSVALLLPDLDAERTAQEPQGCAAALAELATLPPTATPAFATWRRPRLARELGELWERVTRTDRLLDEVVRVEWRPSARRALFAEGLRQVSIALTAIRDVLARRADDLFAAPAPGSADGGDEDLGALPERDVYQEAREVVITDLVDLTIAALRPCWAAIEAGRPTDAAEHAQRTERLLTVYREHVATHGLLTPPPFARDGAHRAALATRLWAGSQVPAALACGVEDEMTQLCHASQLSAVSALADGAQLVRFAPVAVREPTWEAAGPGLAIMWTADGEIAGTLRFVPLRQGVFQ